MTKTAKKHGATSNFITVNPLLILTPTSSDHFHNIQRTPLHVMGMAREGCELSSGLTNNKGQKRLATPKSTLY